MTSQERAKELLQKFWGKGITNKKEVAKQAALICCDEIINHVIENRDAVLFYREVAKEIEKL